jgi:protein-S-isoprenylcysteine O-methyltransferase Ste14
MQNEITFRILLFVLILAFVAHRGYYTRKYGGEGENEERQGGMLSVFANLLAIAAFISTILYWLAPSWVAWGHVDLPVGLRWTGVGVALLGFCLLQWAHNALGRNWRDKPQLIDRHLLVTDGPYRWVRHPIYTAFLVIMSSFLLICANLFIGLMWIGMTAAEVFPRMRYEEGLMLQAFGERYQDYMGRTGRVLPKIT